MVGVVRRRSGLQEWEETEAAGLIRANKRKDKQHCGYYGGGGQGKRGTRERGARD